jgi:hypothetical protein
LEFGGSHLEWCTTLPAPCPSTGKTSLRSQRYEVSLEFGKRRENAGDEVRGLRRCIDRRATPAQHFETNAALRQIIHRVDQVPKITAQSIELPHYQRITLLQSFEREGKARAGLASVRNTLFTNVRFRHTDRNQSVALQARTLRTIAFGNPNVTDQHRVLLAKNILYVLSWH